MLLRSRDFAARRIHWGDKAQSLVEIAAELHLSVSSLVFLDDSPAERERVRATLPDVLVPELSADKLLVPAALAALDCFDAPALTGEDARRGEMIAEERARERASAQVGSVEEWLAGLQTEVRVEALAKDNLARAAQLLNKTNQLNLSTRRLTEEELDAWASRPGRRVLTFRVADKFGDLGLVGLLGTEVSGDTLVVVDFVLSCRVIGRLVEELMVHGAVEIARARGLRRVSARYLPSPRNRPCLEFWRRSRFTADGDVFRWDPREPYPQPSALRLVGGFGD
jgi:FkbH-like protein